MVESGNLAGVGIVSAELRPGPFFLGRIVVGQKQNFRVGMIGGWRCHDQQRRSRLAPAGEIEEIIVGPVAVKIVRPFGFVRSEQEHGAAIGFAGQGLAAHPEIGVRLSVESPCKLTKKKNQQQNLAHSESPGFLVRVYFPVLVTVLLAAIRASTLVLSTSDDPVSTNAGMGSEAVSGPVRAQGGQLVMVKIVQHFQSDNSSWCRASARWWRRSRPSGSTTGCRRRCPSPE